MNSVRMIDLESEKTESCLETDNLHRVNLISDILFKVVGYFKTMSLLGTYDM